MVVAHSSLADTADSGTFDEIAIGGFPPEFDVSAEYATDAVTVTVVEGCYPCDAKCDGGVNAFDIEPFLELLFNGATRCEPCAGDTNGDGNVDAADIEGFINCLFPQRGAAVVPALLATRNATLAQLTVA